MRITSICYNQVCSREPLSNNLYAFLFVCIIIYKFIDNKQNTLNIHDIYNGIKQNSEFGKPHVGNSCSTAIILAAIEYSSSNNSTLSYY